MDPIKLYLKDIRKIPLLTPEEEFELAQRARAGDPEAREAMIRSNLRLVINIAKKYNHLGLPMMDLIEEGNLGLIKAVSKFNPNRGYRFSTYAAWWIKQYVTRALANQGKLVRIPVYMTELIARWKRVTERLTHELGCKPKPKEIAKEMDLPLKKVREISTLVSKVSSLDAPIGDDGDAEFIDLLEDVNQVPVSDEISQVLQHELVFKVMTRLGDRERQVLYMRYGLNDGTPRTLKEIAGEMGITRERVRQIENSALKKLRGFLREVEEQAEKALNGDDGEQDSR
ncbi:MAG: RNA polymerase sigma factor RpoD/SigA [Candidatus Omnitrophica bacterium]|nr:RNA polymerase sigma factor RpoD/SigA [Candidatus Omnitrophota bacterium]